VSLAATSMAVERGAHIIRTHDVAETRDAALIGKEFARDRLRDHRTGDVGIEELDVTTTREAERHLERIGGSSESAGGESDPRAASATAVVRVFELTGLSDGDVGILSTAAAEVGVTVVSAGSEAPNQSVLADGNGNFSATDSTGRTAVVFGTPRAFTALDDAVDDQSAALADALRRISASLT
jgi:dihydropteroate synthase